MKISSPSVEFWLDGERLELDAENVSFSSTVEAPAPLVMVKTEGRYTFTATFGTPIPDEMRRMLRSMWLCCQVIHVKRGCSAGGHRNSKASRKLLRKLQGMTF